MSVPKWLNAVIREFGESINLRKFELNSQGVASLRFETGSLLRFEYALESLAVVMQVPAPPQAELLKRLLGYAQPERRQPFRLRVAYLEKASSAVMLARLAEREVSLPVINSVFTELWRLAEDFRRRMA
ncbi:MAG: CesT family type III secretion system chaperone [Victivallales bacterium]|nr:CesT family type III secretion system chaperone [Victivallales bacterium]